MIHKDTFQRMVRDALVFFDFGLERFQPYIIQGLRRFHGAQVVMDENNRGDVLIAAVGVSTDSYRRLAVLLLQN